MKYYTFFEVTIHEFISYSLELRERTFFNHAFPVHSNTYNYEFDSIFLNKFLYITYEDNKVMRKIFK